MRRLGLVDTRSVSVIDGNNRRRERAVFETDRHTVIGDVTLPPDGYQSRLSDSLNRDEIDFIPLMNVEITPLDGGETVRREFAVLGKAHVKLVYPAGEGV